MRGSAAAWDLDGVAKLLPKVQDAAVRNKRQHLPRAEPSFSVGAICKWEQIVAAAAGFGSAANLEKDVCPAAEADGVVEREVCKAKHDACTWDSLLPEAAAGIIQSFCARIACVAHRERARPMGGCAITPVQISPAARLATYTQQHPSRARAHTLD